MYKIKYCFVLNNKWNDISYSVSALTVPMMRSGRNWVGKGKSKKWKRMKTFRICFVKHFANHARIHRLVKGFRFVYLLQANGELFLSNVWSDFGLRKHTHTHTRRARRIYKIQHFTQIHNTYKCPPIKKNYFSLFFLFYSLFFPFLFHSVRVHAVFLPICHHFIPFCNRDKASQAFTTHQHIYNGKDTRETSRTRCLNGPA